MFCMSTDIRVPAGIPTGGQFASHNRPEPVFALGEEGRGYIRPEDYDGDDVDSYAMKHHWGASDWEHYYAGRAARGEIDNHCPDCGQSLADDLSDATDDGVCLPCAIPDTYSRCENCGEATEAPAGSTCPPCVEANKDEPEDSLSDLATQALAAANLTADAVQSITPLAGGVIVRLREPHPRGGYDSITVTKTVGLQRFRTAFTKNGALHRLDDFALDEGGSYSGEMDFSAWVDGIRQTDPDPELGLSNFRREGSVNHWSGGNWQVEHDTNPQNGYIRFKYDGDVHRDGAPAVFEASKEPRWFQHDTELPNPVPSAPTPIVSSSKTVVQGSNYEPGEAPEKTAERLREKLTLAARAGWLSGAISVKRRGEKITLEVPDFIEPDRVRAIADSFNTYVAGNPATRQYERQIEVVEV